MENEFIQTVSLQYSPCITLLYFSVPDKLERDSWYSSLSVHWKYSFSCTQSGIVLYLQDGEWVYSETVPACLSPVYLYTVNSIIPDCTQSGIVLYLQDGERAGTVSE